MEKSNAESNYFFFHKSTFTTDSLFFQLKEKNYLWESEQEQTFTVKSLAQEKMK